MVLVVNGETFTQRVQHLRDAWRERREAHGFAGAHDFESQYRLLTTLHGWASDAAVEVERVYAGELSISVGPLPVRDHDHPAFSVGIANTFTLTFTLADRPRLGASRWFVAASVGSLGGGPGSVIAAGPERRNGRWTRARLEDLLLSVLGAWERRAEEGPPTLERRRAGARPAKPATPR